RPAALLSPGISLGACHLQVAPAPLRTLAVHQRAAAFAGRLEGADDQPERDRLDLDGNALGLVERLAVDGPLRCPRLRVERDLAGPELARLVDGDEGRLEQVAEGATLRRHAGGRQPPVQRA